MAAKGESAERSRNKATCYQLPYKRGCHNAGLGLILGINSTPFAWGASFKYGYFVFDRVLPKATFEFTLFDGQSQYETGLDLSYFIGPVFGFIIAPGYSLRYLAIRGSNKGDNIAHGPLLYLAIRIRRHFTIGAEFFHNLQKVAGDANEDTRLVFPAFKYSF